MSGVASTSGATAAVDAAPFPATLVEAAAAGDTRAFASIVDAHHRDLARVAYVVAGDVDVAEEAVQAAWSIAWHKLRTLRDPDRLRPWLVSIAANEARQLVRHRSRHRVVELNLAAAAVADDDPLDAIDRVDLANAIRRLSTEDRVLLALRYVAQLESSEIGPLIGMSPSGARGHLSRLLARLRTELDDG